MIYYTFIKSKKPDDLNKGENTKGIIAQLFNYY